MQLKCVTTKPTIVAGLVAAYLMTAPALLAAKPAGAELVKDIYPGAGSSFPTVLTAAGQTLFFAADDGIHGPEVWKSDGTKRGTVLVKDLRPGPDEPWDDTFNMFAVGSTAFFVANADSAGRELWKSDGTDAGTALVEDIRPGADSPFQQSGASFGRAGDTLFFPADDGVNGWELWRSQPPYTASTTSLVEDISPGAESVGVFILDSAAVGDTLFFGADDGPAGNELWKSEPPYTPATTSMVKDIDPLPTRSSFPQRLTVVGDTLFFIAHDGITGWELWRSDGTEAGTVQVEDIEPGLLESALPSELTAVGDTLFFVTDLPSGVELWKSEPPYTAATTDRVASILLFADRTMESLELTAAANTLFFHPDDWTFGREVWRSDGTEAGTVMVKDIYPGAGGSVELSGGNHLTAVGDMLFFFADDGTHGLEPWRSNSTEAGTVLIHDTEPGGGGGVSPPGPAVVGATFYFPAFNPATGTELWKAVAPRT